MMLAIANIKSPRYGDETGNCITVQVQFEGESDWHDYVCRPDDPFGSGAAMHAAALAGEYGEIADFVPPDGALRVPEVISDRQFAQQLAILGTITEAEAIAWAARGDLPETLEQAIATLPTEDGVQFSARMLLSSATTYERSHPMTATLGGVLGYDAAELDDLWRAAAQL